MNSSEIQQPTPRFEPTTVWTPGPANSSSVHVDVGALSHVGKVRANNEDHYLVARAGRSLETLLTNLEPEQIPLPHADVVYGLVVADGMGGVAGGEIASRTAIQDLVQLVLNTPDWILNNQSPWIEEVMERMAKRFRDIDRDINQRGLAEPTLAGMGTTMTLACSLGMEMIVCHIGDSRVYLFRKDQLTQLTRDMTMAQEMIDAGMLQPTQAIAGKLRSVLTQCLGGPGMAKVEVRHVPLEHGDRILLCSDGLYDMVPDKLIAETLRAHPNSQAACQSLVDHALQAGGKDNITVIAAGYMQECPSANPL
jgi:serine/threonine protein phosphatase PrpC